MLRNLKLRTKLLTGFVLVSLVAGMTGYVGVHGSREIRDSLKITANIGAIQALLEIKATASEIEAQTLGFELIDDEPSGEEGSLTAAQKYKLIGRVEEIEKWVYRYDRATRQIQADKSVDWTQSIRDRQAIVVAMAFDSLEFKERGKSGRQLLEKMDELRQAQKDLRGAIAGALQHELTTIEGHIIDSEVTSERVIKLNVLITAVALLLALLLGALLARSISRPITQLTEMVNSLGTTSTKTLGTLRVSSSDEVGQLLRAFKQMTERLKETTVSRDALVKEVNERKRAEEDLASRADELRRSNAELEQFAHVASHDLQEPLRKIQAFGDLLASKSGDSLNDDGRNYLDRMKGAAARMSELITGLLSFSRVTSQAQPHAPVDLQDVTHGVLSDLEVLIEQSGGRVDVGDLPVIEADDLQMRQLMQNLIGNALKFQKPEEPPVVKVESRFINGTNGTGNKQLSEAKLCELTVQDNGIGFDEKYVDRIFGIFQRLHGRSAYEGTGIGLATCRKIVERHGGSITAKSHPGEGATFLVRLPVIQPKGER